MARVTPAAVWALPMRGPVCWSAHPQTKCNRWRERKGGREKESEREKLVSDVHLFVLSRVTVAPLKPDVINPCWWKVEFCTFRVTPSGERWGCRGWRNSRAYQLLRNELLNKRKLNKQNSAQNCEFWFWQSNGGFFSLHFVLEWFPISFLILILRKPACLCAFCWQQLNPPSLQRSGYRVYVGWQSPLWIFQWRCLATGRNNTSNESAARKRRTRCHCVISKHAVPE